MDVTVISDTHGIQPTLPGGDLLIHCGDITGWGKRQEIIHYIESYLLKAPYKYKVIIPGNHDLWCQSIYYDSGEYFNNLSTSDERTLFSRFIGYHVPDGFYYLIDREINIEGLRIYGTPWMPIYYDWAFMKPERELHEHYAKIPEGIDILITHTPPKGILSNEDPELCNKGSSALLYHINRAKPRINCHGHIHEFFGHTETNGVKYFNCAIMDRQYKPVNKPTTFTIEPIDK